jgi:hypothetical protein
VNDFLYLEISIQIQLFYPSPLKKLVPERVVPSLNNKTYFVKLLTGFTEEDGFETDLCR